MPNTKNPQTVILPTILRRIHQHFRNPHIQLRRHFKPLLASLGIIQRNGPRINQRPDNFNNMPIILHPRNPKRQILNLIPPIHLAILYFTLISLHLLKINRRTSPRNVKIDNHPRKVV
ncbi:hypothetical protein AA313_de0209987 [Arthrobotrys entomopaga]|nr:hypothetical protein AA313_de0209987 [Arthrobotrys entomopaga]